MDININKIAEVIVSNSNEYVAQCYKLDVVPQLGYLVKTIRSNDEEIYGVVYYIETRGLEPGRRVLVRGDKLDKEEDVFKSNPQLVKLLVTDFKVLILGYSREGNIYHSLPPYPPSIHSFVYPCGESEIISFTESSQCLSLLAESKLIVSADEIITAFIRHVSKYYKDPIEFIIKSSRELVWIYGGDIKRLNSLLKRLAYAAK